MTEWDLVPAAFALLFTGGIGYGLIPRFYRSGSAKWIDRVGACIDPEVREIVQQARGQRLACSCAGGLGGLTAGLAIILVVPQDLLVRATIFIGAMIVGVCTGTVLHAFAVSVRADGGPIRVARARVSRLGDYVRPRSQILIRVEVVLATVLCAMLANDPIWDGTSFTTTGSGPLWAVTALIPLCYVVTELLVGRLLRRPTPGASPRSIVWHDALRRETVVDLFTLPSGIVLLAALLAYTWVSNPWAELPYSAGKSLAVFACYLTACYVPGVFQRLNAPKPPTLVAAA